jgi:transposase-like protein
MGRGPGSLLDFQTTFADEEACIEYLAARRWPDGFACPKCGSNDAWRLAARPLWECRGCGRQTSVTAGTLMAKTKLPLRVWFWAAHLMSTHSNGVSALQLRHQPGLSYPAAWLLEAKLRRAMVNPGRAKLQGLVEIDQAEIHCREAEPSPEIGGRQGMITVIGAVEVVDRETGGPPKWSYNKKLLDTRPQRIRLQVIPNNEAATIEAFVQANVEPGSVILTGGQASYGRLQALGYRHDPKVAGLMAAHLVLPWVHRAFALLKRWGLGVYHGLRRKYVQTYLDEYCFRFNRRYWRSVSFEKILNITAAQQPLYRHEIIGSSPRNYATGKARRSAKLASETADLARKPRLEPLPETSL